MPAQYFCYTLCSLILWFYLFWLFAENKRKIEDQSDTTNTKTKRVEDQRKCSDLIVLGLAWKTTDKELREYFEREFGQLLMAQVKKDPKSGNSKGFGFIRFSDYENQAKVVSKRHLIDGRWCDVRVPMSKDSHPNEYRDRNQEFNRKIFIGRITSSITVDELRDYFSKYGDINDIFIPKPFRGFAFVTFQELTGSHTLFGDDHIIKGISVHVSNAVPKVEMNSQQQQAVPYNNNSNNNSKQYRNDYGTRYSSSGYSSYSNNSHLNMSTAMSPSHHPTNYSPNYSPPAQYDYYGRQRPSQHAYPHEPSNNPYNRNGSLGYGSFTSNDYSSYY